VALHVELDPARGDAYRGEVAIALRLARPTRAIRLHAVDLRVSGARLDL
jgi:aminopeptidase N